MSSDYGEIPIAGGDTGQPLAMAKRLAWIARYLQPNAGRFLDCGCGAGDYVSALRRELELDASGVEFDEGKVRTAREEYGLGEHVRQGDLQNLDLPSSHWNYAMLNEVLEHVPDEARALREVHRVLQPRGILFVFSPNRWYPFETHGIYVRRTKARVPHWVPFIPYIPIQIGSHFFTYWARNYWHRQLRQLLVNGQFSIVDCGYIWQTFEGISGRQPQLLTSLAPYLRVGSNFLESAPLIRRFGVSQVFVCQKAG